MILVLKSEEESRFIDVVEVMFRKGHNDIWYRVNKNTDTSIVYSPGKHTLIADNGVPLHEFEIK